MKKTITTATALACLLCAQAQITIDGRHVSVDEQAHTMLATVPERLFGTDATLEIRPEDGWGDIVVTALSADSNTPLEGFCNPRPLPSGNDGEKTPGLDYTFSDVCAESKYLVSTTASDGTPRTDTLRFTFLPIVQLLPPSGTDVSTTATYFSNEYQPALVLFSHPDSARTDTLTARVKWRGGTTNAASKHKRNYKLNFDADQRFFGLRNDDKWMLDAGQPDVFRLRNRIAMDLWNKMARKPYYADQEPKALNGVRGDVVELFLGEEWRGIYNLSEFMDRKQLKLKKVDSQTGDIRGCLYKGVTWDKTRMFEHLGTYDNTKDTYFGYEMKYPELADDSDTVDWTPLVVANNFAHDSSDDEFQQHVDEYFDMPVVTDYNIFYNVVNAVDNAGKNMYWAVYDKTESKRLTPAPWDLDATFGQRWGGQLVNEIEEGFYHSPEFKMDFELRLTYRMFRDNFNDYLGQLNARYRYLRQPGQPLATDSILAIVSHYYEAIKKSGAASREEAKWSGDSDVWGDVIDFDTEYAYICDWIRRRMEFIDTTEIPLFYKKAYFDELGIQQTALTAATPQSTFDLCGRKITGERALKPGIYVRNGKKMIKR